MLKREFLSELECSLSHLPHHKRDRAIDYHSGIIDGKIEAGLSEEEAVAAFGSPDKAALEFIKGGSGEQKHRISKKIRSLPTALRLVLSTAAVIFCMLLMAAVAMALLSVYLLVTLVGLGGAIVIGGGAFMCFATNPPVGVCVIGIGFVIAAVSLFLLGPARAITKFTSRFCSFIIGKIRGLLAKEALSV